MRCVISASCCRVSWSSADVDCWAADAVVAGFGGADGIGRAVPGSEEPDTAAGGSWAGVEAQSSKAVETPSTRLVHAASKPTTRLSTRTSYTSTRSEDRHEGQARDST